MTDLQFEEFLHQCNQVDYDPFLEWWKNCDNHLGESQVPLSFGLKDTTGTSVYPKEISTDYIIERYMAQL